VLLLNYALKFGYVYERWLGIVMTIFKKDPGSPKLHHLRAIHLYEWDWKLPMGVKWRHLLHLACDQKFINENCYGSMPGKECLDPVFVKELEYEIARLTCRAVIMNDDNSKANYNRIHAFVANVVGHSKGLNKKVCIVHGRTLKEAKCHVQTKMGISKQHIQHGRFYPLLGTGQCSTTSPPMWWFTCSALFATACVINKAQDVKGALHISVRRRVEGPIGSLTINIKEGAASEPPHGWGCGAALSHSKQGIKPAMLDVPLGDAHLGLDVALGLLKSLTMHNAHFCVKAFGAANSTKNVTHGRANCRNRWGADNG